MIDKINNPHTQDVRSITEILQVDAEKGLSSEVAHARLNEYGRNELDTGKKVSALKILFHNLNNIIVYLLIIASIVAFAMGDSVEGFAVIVAIIIAVASGFVSEYKAQKSIESLQNMVKTVAKVIREGEIQEIDSAL